jgi:hypothetical protein
MERKDNSSIKPQEVISIIRTLETGSNQSTPLFYPELTSYLANGYYVDRFSQLLISPTQLLITFSLRRFNPSTY